MGSAGTASGGAAGASGGAAGGGGSGGSTIPARQTGIVNASSIGAGDNLVAYAADECGGCKPAIWKLFPSAGNASTVVTNLLTVPALVINPASGTIYFAQADGVKKIANGSGTADPFGTTPNATALEVAGSGVFAASSTAIWSRPFSGGSDTSVVSANIAPPSVGQSAGKVYFFVGGAQVDWAPDDGSGSATKLLDTNSPVAGTVATGWFFYTEASMVRRLTKGASVQQRRRRERDQTYGDRRRQHQRVLVGRRRRDALEDSR